MSESLVRQTGHLGYPALAHLPHGRSLAVRGWGLQLPSHLTSCDIEPPERVHSSKQQGNLTGPAPVARFSPLCTQFRVRLGTHDTSGPPEACCAHRSARSRSSWRRDPVATDAFSEPRCEAARAFAAVPRPP